MSNPLTPDEMREKLRRLRETEPVNEEAENKAREMVLAMYELANDLVYPQDAQGNVFDPRFIAPQLAHHLIQAGWRKDPEKARIKRRALPPTAGVPEDAVEWVPVDAPDDIEEELRDVKLSDIKKLSPMAQAIAARRLGAPVSEVPNDKGWNMKPQITVTDYESIEAAIKDEGGQTWHR